MAISTISKISPKSVMVDTIAARIADQVVNRSFNEAARLTWTITYNAAVRELNGAKLEVA